MPSCLSPGAGVSRIETKRGVSRVISASNSSSVGSLSGRSSSDDAMLRIGALSMRIGSRGSLFSTAREGCVGSE